MKLFVLSVSALLLSLACLSFVVYWGLEQEKREDAVSAQLKEISELLKAVERQQLSALSQINEVETSQKAQSAAFDSALTLMSAKLDEVGANQKAQGAAIDSGRTSMAAKLNELLVEGSAVSSKADQLLENLLPKQKKVELLTVDLGDVGQGLATRKRAIESNRQVISDEQKNLVSLLTRKRSDLSRRLYPDDRQRTGIEKKKDDELTAEELGAVNKLRTEIDELEREVGHLVIPPVSLFDGADIAQAYLVRAYGGSGAIIVNTGFHGRGRRIIYSPEDLSVTDLTSKLLQEVSTLTGDMGPFQMKEKVGETTE
ncbi:hypothetical protein VSU19_02795 [Verrucomicrobiales bacterium BCK34]|nr:hypothetical protein [Verrucomicrobiales bacterium BCK34]